MNLIDTSRVTSYRADIDGLRAIGVLAVVFFHAFPAVFPGGYIGVDIFFVISGFLITRILVNDIESGTFSILDFYKRRVRRIFPALMLVLVAAIFFGWICLIAVEYEQLGKHIAGGALFISNLLLWKEAGYFDVGIYAKPLLHLWSLGVEEQFYLIWPLILWLTCIPTRGKKISALFVLGVGSFAFNAIGININPIAIFYSPLSRFWEFMIGACFSLIGFLGGGYVRNNASWSNFLSSSTVLNIAAVIGITSILWSIFYFSDLTLFPGFWALFPTVATFFLIYSGSFGDKSSWSNRYLLSNPVIVKIGLISYPLYLWHWPLLSFARILNQGEVALSLRISIVMISVLLAWATYLFVEIPIRHSKKTSKFIYLLAIMAAIFCIGVLIVVQKGFPDRPLQIYFDATNKTNDNQWHAPKTQGLISLECGVDNFDNKFFSLCFKQKNIPSYYALVGDSKAEKLAMGLVYSAAPTRGWVVMAGPGDQNGKGPVPILTKAKEYASYQKPLSMALESIESNPEIKVVVFTNAVRKIFNLLGNGNYFDEQDLKSGRNLNLVIQGLSATVERLRSGGKKVVFVVDNPTLLKNAEECIYRKTDSLIINNFFELPKDPRCEISADNHLRSMEHYYQALAIVKKRYPADFFIFDTFDFYCSSVANICGVTKNGHRLYGRTDHISEDTGFHLAIDLNKFLSKISD